VRIRDGVEGHIPTSEIVESQLEKGEDGEPKPLKVGDTVKAEIANIDTQDRRLTLTMRAGEGTHAAAAATSGSSGASTGSAPKGEKRESRAPKKAADDAKAVGSIGELIKQKLGGKLGLGAAEGKEGKEDEKADDDAEDKEES
jgi:ribosomal protein S1